MAGCSAQVSGDIAQVIFSASRARPIGGRVYIGSVNRKPTAGGHSEIARMLWEEGASPKQSGSQESLTRRGVRGVVEDFMGYGGIGIVTGFGAARQLKSAENPNHWEEGEAEQGVDSAESTHGSRDSENNVCKR